jgi:type IV pilus assembly protein PilM
VLELFRRSMFEFGKNIFLGLDVGTSSVKVAEITVVEGKAVLTNYAWMPIENLAQKFSYNSAFFDVALPKYIKKMISDAHFKGKNVYVSIPAFGGLITLIDFPNMPRKEIEQAIKYEAHKYIPIALEEVVVSWDILGQLRENDPKSDTDAGANSASQVSSEDDKVQVLLVAASKNKVAKYENLVKNIGLKLKSIEIEVFSMVNSLIGNDQGTFVILDIGSRVCNIILVSKGVIIANRNLDSGGDDFTKTIANGMNIDAGRAESLKVSDKNFFSKDSSISFPALEMIMGELARLVETSVKNKRVTRIDSIILSGGSAKLTGLTEYLSNTFSVKTIVGNPLSRVGYDRRLQPVVEKIQTHFSVCIGLALKGAEEYMRNKK